MLEPFGVRQFHGFSYCLHPRLPVPVRVLSFLQVAEYFHEEFLNSEVPFFRLERNRKHVIFDITHANLSTSFLILVSLSLEKNNVYLHFTLGV